MSQRIESAILPLINPPPINNPFEDGRRVLRIMRVPEDEAAGIEEMQAEQREEPSVYHQPLRRSIRIAGRTRPHVSIARGSGVPPRRRMRRR